MPVRYFEDEDDEIRYAVDGENGENMVTSEGYTREPDARRGYEDLVREIVRSETALVTQLLGELTNT